MLCVLSPRIKEKTFLVSSYKTIHSKIIAIITPFFGQAEQLIPLILFVYISHKKFPTHTYYIQNPSSNKEIYIPWFPVTLLT
jgi:hypothetical protein